MAKLTRKTQKVFASGASNNGQFGSAQAGTPTTSTDLDTLQNLSAFESGWLAAVLSGSRLPPLEEFQALDYISTRQLAYLFQEGIAEYDSGTEYHENSIVKQTGTYKLYGSITNNNQGNALTDAANWELLVDLTNVFTSADIATEAEAGAGTSNTVLLSPLRGFDLLKEKGSYVEERISFSAAAQADVDLLDVDTHFHYIFIENLSPSVNGATISALLSTDGGSTTIASYDGRGRIVGASNTDVSINAQSDITLLGTSLSAPSNAADQNACIDMIIPPQTSGKFPNVMLTEAWENSGGAYQWNSENWRANTTSQVNLLRISASSGTISGNIVVRKVKR